MRWGTEPVTLLLKCPSYHHCQSVSCSVAFSFSGWLSCTVPRDDACSSVHVLYEHLYRSRLLVEFVSCIVYQLI